MTLQKTILLGAISILALGGCNELTGRFQVKEKISLIETYSQGSPFDSGRRGGRGLGSGREQVKTRPIEIEAGDYQATISGSSKSLTVALKLKKQAKLVFNTQGAQIPSGSGPINLPSSISGQPIDVRGHMNVDISDSEDRRDSEQCSYTRTVRRCYREDGGRERCIWEEVTYYGRQTVEYFIRSTTQSLSTQIFKPASEEALGSLYGSRTDNDKIYTYRGECY